MYIPEIVKHTSREQFKVKFCFFQNCPAYFVTTENYKLQTKVTSATNLYNRPPFN